MWMHLYLKMDSLIKCFLFSNVFLFLGHWWRTGGDWDESWSKRRMTFPPNWCNSGFKGGRCPGCCKRCESDMTYGQEWWPILGICALHLSHPKCTHTAVNTHTHTRWAAIYAVAPGEQLGVRCLAQGHLSRGIEGGESAGYSLPPPTIPAGNLWVTSLTL